MYKIKINEQTEWNLSVQEGNIQVNGAAIAWDLRPLPDGSFSVLANGRSYNAVVEEVDRTAKQMKLKVNGHPYRVVIREPIDQLLEKMGLNFATTKKLAAIKAPMPGLVLKIMVEEGQEVKKGDPVLVLEAMKMENVFKAPADAIVKAIKAVPGAAVEKGAVLIELA